MMYIFMAQQTEDTKASCNKYIQEHEFRIKNSCSYLRCDNNDFCITEHKYWECVRMMTYDYTKLAKCKEILNTND